MDALKQEYARILQGLQIDKFNLDEDKYSGVFLPDPFDEYWTAKTKVMLIGRETASWNTANKLNTIKRAVGLGGVPIEQVVEEAYLRYRKHLKSDDEKVITTSRSHFKRYYFRLAKELELDPRALVYANLFAWDYANKSPLKRPAVERQEIISVSQQLLAAQIRCFKPDFIVFAAGVTGFDPVLRGLFEEQFGGYKTVDVIPRKLWEFKAANATCFRIAHPRAAYDHPDYRTQVIERIKAHMLA